MSVLVEVERLNVNMRYVFVVDVIRKLMCLDDCSSVSVRQKS